MDLSSEKCIEEFRQHFYVKMCRFRGKNVDSVDIDPQQGSLTTLIKRNWKTLYSIPLIMQEWVSASSRRGELPNRQ